MVHLSPAMRAVEPYPFEALDRRRQAAIEAGRRLIDFGVGDPREETPSAIRHAFAEAIEPVSSYPRAAGIPELRQAIAGWAGRRFGVDLDPDTAVLPTLGSKELVFSLAQAVLDPAEGKDLVLVTSPGYPIPERGARFAGGAVRRLPLTEERGFLPDLDALDHATWDRASILWLNYPNNPTGAVAPLSFLRDAADRCRAHDVLLASDEAYSELWFGAEPPASALQVGDLAGIVVLNTLSKRSSMTGYRSGFAAGDADLVAALRRLRPSVGVTPQEVVQRASVVAWNDEHHVEDNRARYAAKREVFLRLFERHGIHVAGSVAGLYLWVRLPDATSSEDWALDLLDRTGVVVAPGSFFGSEGEGYVRMAMVPTLAACRDAAELLDAVLAEVPRVTDLADLALRIEDRGSGSPDDPGAELDADAVEAAIDLLDRGEVRAAEPDGDGGWRVNAWAKQAVLLYFRVRGLTTTQAGPFEYHDKLPLKSGYEALGVRVVPPATARYGAHLEPGVVLMPSYVNIGAWVGAGTMVDTWATVGSCAQIGAGVHLAGGVGVGGVLEPVQAAARRDRGRGVHRFPLHRGRGRARRSWSRARRRCGPHREHPGHRRDGRRGRRAPRLGPRARRSSSRGTALGRSRPATTACPVA